MSFTTASPALSRPSKRSTMSVTQTYFLAHKARAKLSREAAQPDHDLRLLVGHANLLDSLMLELADAERDQERWFNQSVRGTSKPRPKPSNLHIQWADQVMEDAVDEEEYDSCASDSDSDDSDYDDDEVTTGSSITTAPLPVATPQIVITHEDGEEDDVEEDDDLEEDYAQLELVRTHSHSSTPPELVDHDSESSDDEALPPSPADAELPLLDKDVEVSEQEDSLFDQEDFYKPSPASLAPAIPVY